jgi:hypothetical protein
VAVAAIDAALACITVLVARLESGKRAYVAGSVLLPRKVKGRIARILNRVRARADVDRTHPDLLRHRVVDGLSEPIAIGAAAGEEEPEVSTCLDRADRRKERVVLVAPGPGQVRRIPTADANPGLPVVSTFEPSGYTAPRPISAVVPWICVFGGGDIRGVADRSNDALVYGPLGY